jgi:hypothetical protein
VVSFGTRASLVWNEIFEPSGEIVLPPPNAPTVRRSQGRAVT